MEKKKLNIGLDIGTTSVGWSLMDDDSNIINLGVRLFEDPANPKDGKLGNIKRREARHRRRTVRRIRHRKDRLIKFFVNNNLISNEDELTKIFESHLSCHTNCNSVIEIKVKGLNEKLTQKELLIILFHYIHHRGYSYIDLSSEENEIDLDEINKKSDKYPSELLLEFFNENGFYRGADLNKTISKWDYKKEIIKILETQGWSKELIDEYINIFEKNREFNVGPGSEKSPTKYGLYRKENGEVKKIGDNLWDATIGYCTIYKNEKLLRGAKKSPKAELFNLLNDLNNLRITTEEGVVSLTKEQKNKLFDDFCNSLSDSKTKNINLKQIAKTLNISVDDISGYKNTKGKEITELNNIKYIAKAFISANLLDNVNIRNKDQLDLINEFYELLRKSPSDVLEQAKLVQSSEKFKNISELEDFFKLLKNLANSLSQTHSLSYKAMDEYINYAFEGSDNQRLFFDDKLKSLNSDTMQKSKYIDKSFLDDMIISPTTKRSLLQSIKVLNKIIKLYSKEWDIGNITIEMPRDKNSYEEKKNIEKMQKNNREKITKICDQFNVDLEKLNSTKKLKLILWTEQDGKDIYSGETIDIMHVLNNTSEYDIDHIIPYSISFMDGRKNKVLTHKYNNQDNEKGNKTPYQWLSSKGKFEEFKLRVDDLYEKKLISKEKRDLLLYKNDPIKDMGGFLEKNLVDTRYASSELLHKLQQFQSLNQDLYPNLKIKVISGSITDYVRYGVIKMKKERDIYHHHAVDASIVNFLGNNPKISTLSSWTTMKNRDLRRNKDVSKDEYLELIDYKNGEKLSLSTNFKEDLGDQNIISKFRIQLDEKIANDQIKFSRQLVTRNNRQLSDETIYSIRWKDEDSFYLINSLKILEAKNDDLAKYFGSDAKDKESLLCYQYEKKLYAELNSIYKNYIELDKKQNPFVSFMKNEHNIDKPKYLVLNNKKIKRLRKITDNKKTDNVILLDKKHNNKAALESLNALEIHLYKDNNNKYNTIPINQKVLISNGQKNIINKDKLEKVLQTKNIDINSKKIIIKNGTVFAKKDSNKLFYSNGGGNFNQSLLEIKSLFCSNEKYFPRKQMNISISTIINEYDICEVDELGNIYNRKSIML